MEELTTCTHVEAEAAEEGDEEAEVRHCRTRRQATASAIITAEQAAAEHKAKTKVISGAGVAEAETKMKRSSRSLHHW